MFPRDLETKRKLAEAITKVVSEIAKSRPEVIHVIFKEILKENWSKAGKLKLDRE
jgi:phenylpyruvate tautomerase PptA (4-oxalocrotonate tautomerase family)